MNKRPNIYRQVAKVGMGRVPKKPKIKAGPLPKRRPYPKPKLPPKPSQPTSQVPSLSGTGVTTTSGGDIPGAPPADGMPAQYRPPNIKNWGKASAAQIAQAQLAPQYASVWQQQHQSQLMGGQQQAAITGFGAALTKILGEAGPGGVKGTLGPDFGAALSMQALRNFAYQQFLESAKYADEYAKIAAQYPSLVTQQLAYKADEARKDAAFEFQKLVATQTYGLNVAKTKAYNAATVDRSKQAWARIGISSQNAQIAMKRYGLSAGQLKLQIAKEQRYIDQYNQKRTDERKQISYSASRGAGRWVNKFGQPLNIGLKNPIQIGKGDGNKPKKPGGLTDTQYRNAYGDALGNAKAAREHGVSRAAYLEQAVINHIPRAVAAKAWRNTKPKPYPKGVGRGNARVSG